MKITRLLAPFAIYISLFSVNVFAQANEGPAVGQWRSFFSYYQGTGLATDGGTLYCVTESGFFTYDTEDHTISSYSKATGMSDVGLTAVASDPVSGYTILAYENANIDLFKDHTFYNIPDLMIAAVIGDKKVNDIVAHDGLAYLSTNLGLITVNLKKREIRETIQFYDGTTVGHNSSATIRGNEIYVATSVGIFKTELDNPFIQNYLTWQRITPQAFSQIRASGDNLYVAGNHELFRMDPDNSLHLILAREEIRHLDPGKDGSIWMCVITPSGTVSNFGLSVDANGIVTDSFRNTADPRQICQLPDGSVWFVDNYDDPGWGGLRKVTSESSSDNYSPAGPKVNSVFDVWAKNGELWVAHGGVSQTWTYQYNYSFFSHYQNGSWVNYANQVAEASNHSPFTSDCLRIIKDDQFTGNVYASAFVGGLYELKPDGSLTNYREGFLERAFGDTATYRLAGLAIDNNGDLWMANYSATQELKVKTRDGNWYEYHVLANSQRSATDLIIDNAGQKWYVTPGGGVAVYNDNGTLANKTDDASMVLKAGEGFGNLPDNNTLCIAKDKDGAIWIGTTNGIGIVSCPELVLQHECESELRIVQYPGQANAGYLFMNQTVNSIAVDGANRKWIGTSQGVWLVSDDAMEVIHYFTAEDSPLPSNFIYRVQIDPVTGDVYMATPKGLVSYRGGATEATEEQEKSLLIYPNPVPPGYTGTIAIRGLAEQSDVRITDIRGQLVYHTTALGGQATWNGKDYTGRKVQTGVYLIFAINRDGSEKTTGKLIVNE